MAGKGTPAGNLPFTSSRPICASRLVTCSQQSHGTSFTFSSFDVLFFLFLVLDSNTYIYTSNKKLEPRFSPDRPLPRSNLFVRLLYSIQVFFSLHRLTYSCFASFRSITTEYHYPNFQSSNRQKTKTIRGLIEQTGGFSRRMTVRTVTVVVRLI
jgi:hypothetical protein